MGGLTVGENGGLFGGLKEGEPIPWEEIFPEGYLKEREGVCEGALEIREE